MNDAIYNNKTNFSADSHSMHFPSSALVGATGDALAAGAWLRRGSILVQVVLVNLAVIFADHICQSQWFESDGLDLNEWSSRSSY